MSEFRQMFRVASFYAAAFIGAGFASGQEILEFFTQYGRAGLMGVALSSSILTIGSVLILNKSKDNAVHGYSDFFRQAGGRLSPYLDMIYSLFTLAGLAVMLAGSGALISQTLGIKGGSLVTALLIAIVIRTGRHGMLDLSTVLVPIMFIVLIIPNIYQLMTVGIVIPQQSKPVGYASAVLYASYNLCYGMAVLTVLHTELTSKKQSWGVSLIGNGLVGLTLLIVVLGLWSVGMTPTQQKMPMLVLVERLHPVLARSFSVVLYLAMFTTALAHSFALTNRVSTQTTVPEGFAVLLVLALGLVFARLGFGPLVSLAYPMVGVIGLFMFGALLKK